MTAKEQLAKAYMEAFDLQMSKPPVLTNAEEDPDVRAAWEVFNNIVANNGLSEADIEDAISVIH